MHTVQIDASNDRLRQLVEIARGGETVVVVENDRAVAELRPLETDLVAEWNNRRAAASMQPLTAFEEQGVREGWLTPATEHGPLPEGEPSELEPGQLMDDLARDREDR